MARAARATVVGCSVIRMVNPKAAKASRAKKKSIKESLFACTALRLHRNPARVVRVARVWADRMATSRGACATLAGDLLMKLAVLIHLTQKGALMTTKLLYLVDAVLLNLKELASPPTAGPFAVQSQSCALPTAGKAARAKEAFGQKAEIYPNNQETTHSKLISVISERETPEASPSAHMRAGKVEMKGEAWKQSVLIPPKILNTTFPNVAAAQARKICVKSNEKLT